MTDQERVNAPCGAEPQNEQKEETFQTTRQLVERVFNSLDPVFRQKLEEEVRVVSNDPVLHAQFSAAVLVWQNQQLMQMAKRVHSLAIYSERMAGTIQDHAAMIRGLLEFLEAEFPEQVQRHLAAKVAEMENNDVSNADVQRDPQQDEGEVENDPESA